jgi:hypothetical protein
MSYELGSIVNPFIIIIAWSEANNYWVKEDVIRKLEKQLFHFFCAVLYCSVIIDIIGDSDKSSVGLLTYFYTLSHISNKILCHLFSYCFDNY